MLHLIRFEKKCELNELIPYGARSVNWLFSTQHFNEHQAYEYCQTN